MAIRKSCSRLISRRRQPPRRRRRLTRERLETRTLLAADTATFSVGNVSGAPGNQVAVPIDLSDGSDNLSANNPVQAIEVVVTYDPSELTVNSATAGSLLTTGGQSWVTATNLDYNNTGNTLVLGAVSSQGLSGDFSGTAFSITFTINAGASGATNADVVASTSDGQKATAVTLEDNSNLVLNPAPTNGSDDPVVGTVSIAAITNASGQTITAAEGKSFSGEVASFADAGASSGDFTASINWGDNQSSTGAVTDAAGGGFIVNGSHTYAEEGTQSVTVTIADNNGNTTTATGSAQIGDLAVNATPQTLAGTEGATTAYNVATFTDPGGTEPIGDYSADIAWGDGATTTTAPISVNSGVFTVSGTHAYAEEGLKAPVVTISHDTAPPVTVTASINVADPAVVATPASLSAVEGASSSFDLATFTDPAGAEASGDYSATITWGDGSVTPNASISLNAGIFTVSGSHTYAEDGTKSPVIAITHDTAPATTTTATVSVSDAALHGAATASATGGVEGVTPAALSGAAFTDDNTAAPASDFSVSAVDWGDGNSSTAGLSITGSAGSYTVSGSHLFTEEGVHNFSITVKDTGGSTATITGTADVSDAVLTGVTTASATGGVEDVTPATLSGATFTDANAAAAASDFSVSAVNWGDGGTSTAGLTVTGSAGNYTVGGSHLYTEDGAHSFSITVKDTGGSTATITGATDVADALLTGATSASAGGGVENVTSATLSGATFTDASAAAPLSDFSVTAVAWGDGQTDTAGLSLSGSAGHYTVSGSHLYVEDGVHNFAITIADKGGSVATITGAASVGDAALHAVATGSATGGVEGVSPATLSGAAFTDDNTAAPASDFSVSAVNWGDGNSSTTGLSITGSAGSYSVSGSHLFTEEGVHNFSITVKDTGGSTATITGTSNVADAALAAKGATISAARGATFSGAVATFTDANTAAALGDFSATVNWDDGTATTLVSGAQMTVSNATYTVAASHVYTTAGTFHPTVTISDLGGSAATAVSTANVSDHSLTATALSVTGTEGGSVNQAVATFSDLAAGAPSDYAATIVWGDGATTTGTVSAAASGGFSVVGSHAYTEEGTYSVAVSIAGPAGSQASATSTAKIADAPLTGSLVEINTSAFIGTLATFHDANPGATSGDFKSAIDWGDGTSSNGTVAPAGDGFSISGSHVYLDPATLPVVATVTDTGGSNLILASSGNLQIAAQAVGKTSTGAVLYARPATALSDATVASFTLGDGSPPAASFQASVDWGDGITSTSTVSLANGVYSVLGSHTYATVGDFSTTTTATLGDSTIVLLGHALIGGANQQYVMAVYEDVLGRAPDSAGLTYWTQQLDQAQTQGAQAFATIRGNVAEAISHSAEYYGNIVIRPVYLKLLDRAADDAGVAYWTKQMQSGLTDQQLEEMLAASDEFFTKFGGTNSGWVAAVYEQLLGRQGEASGQSYWLSQLNAKEQSGEPAAEARQEVAAGIAGSQENNTNLIEQDYFHYLGRAADQAGLTYWLEQFTADKTNEDLIGGFTGSDEYYKGHTG